MDHNELKATLTRPDFLGELHHLLWTEPHEHRGLWDEAWNCRDHALVTSALAHLLGFVATVGYGQATFVQGPSGKLPPIGMAMSIHSWTMVEKGGIYDLSPRLAKTSFPGWRPSSVTAIAQSKCQPIVRTKFSFFLKEHEYESTVDLSSHEEGEFHAVYWGQRWDSLSRKIMGDTLNFCNSPLTDVLRAHFGERGDLHARAILHLWEFLKGEAPSLSRVPQIDAWSRLVDRKGDAVFRVCSRGRIQ